MSDFIAIKMRQSREVIDLEDFASLFAGIGAQFDDFVRERYPEAHGYARMGIRELRQGSLLADLVAVSVGTLLPTMDHALVVSEFLQLLKIRLDTLGSGVFLDGARKKDLENITQMVQAVANDPDATVDFSYRQWDQTGILRKEIIASVNTSTAKAITKTAARQKAELDKTHGVDYERAFMVFTRADVGDAPVDKRSGERVVIEEISNKSLALNLSVKLGRTTHQIGNSRWS